MNLGDLIKYCNFLMNRDQLGDPVDPDDINVLLKVVNLQKFEDEYKELLMLSAQKEIPLSVLITISNPLNTFKKEYEGQGETPMGYHYYVSLRGFYNGIYRPIDVLTEQQYDERSIDPVGRPFTEYPIAKYMPGEFVFHPIKMDPTKITYLRLPIEPYYDSCLSQMDEYSRD